jgi:enterochelin esterase-like enzyme
MPRRVRTASLTIAVALVLFVTAEAVGGGGSSSAATLQYSAFRSHAVNSRLHFLIALPEGYTTSGLRYPVVYFLHGLPASPTSYQNLTWVAQSLDQTGRQAIVVVPQAASSSVSDPEYHDWGPGKNWETAIAKELTTYVDTHYRTIANRAGRAIIGFSAGGYGATILGIHHPAEYSVVESWSGYFRPTDPTGEKTLDVGSKVDNDDASVHKLVPRLQAQFRRYPTLLGFYVGQSDPTFVSDNVRLDRELRKARVSHVFQLYAGGHTTALWQSHAVQWLQLALDRLRAPTA